MMAIAISGKNLMLNALATAVTHVSLHSGFPCTGANEISGGTPAYARKAVTFGTAANGEISISNEPVFDVPASTTVAAIGFWTAVTAGTMHADYDATDEIYANQGTYKIVSGSIALTEPSQEE